MRAFSRWVLLLALLPGLAHARAGGGEDFGGEPAATSSGSASYDASSGTSGDVPIGDMPVSPVVSLLAGALLVAMFARSAKMMYDDHVRLRAVPAPNRAPADPTLDRPPPGDPGWSRFVAEEMAWLVIQRVYGADTAEAREALDPWAEPIVGKLLHREGPFGDVVIGALRLARRGVNEGREQLEFEVRLVRAGSKGGFWARESWFFERPPGIRSPSLQIVQALGCPACGAPTVGDAQGRCPGCGATTADGAAGWRASLRVVREERPRAIAVDPGRRVFLTPWTLREAGHTAATVLDPALGDARAAWNARHPNDCAADVEARARTVFLRVQDAWDRDAWLSARPVASDRAWLTLRASLEQNRRAGVVNHVRDVRIESCELVRVAADAWYDQFTFRFRAGCRDWTESAAGAVIGGSGFWRRRFSEYWTFVRTVERPSGARAAEGCPSCGSPLDRVDATGACGACGTMLSTGRFDWVLARIEQAEGYAGPS